jgi:hypothetical protein
VACTRSSARCQSSHSTAASRRSDDSLAATYSVYSASRLRLTRHRHVPSRAPQSQEASGVAFGCHARAALSAWLACQGRGGPENWWAPGPNSNTASLTPAAPGNSAISRPYEMAPTASELTRWLNETADLAALLAPQLDQ